MGLTGDELPCVVAVVALSEHEEQRTALPWLQRAFDCSAAQGSSEAPTWPDKLGMRHRRGFRQVPVPAQERVATRGVRGRPFIGARERDAPGEFLVVAVRCQYRAALLVEIRHHVEVFTVAWWPEHPFVVREHTQRTRRRSAVRERRAART